MPNPEPIRPNLWDFFLITLNGYIAFTLRGTVLGWICALLTAFLAYIAIYALLTGDTIVKRD